MMIFEHYTKSVFSKPDFSPILANPAFSTQNAIQLLEIGDLSRILIVLGLFIGYSYLFHYLKTTGANLLSNSSNENQKMGVAFFYTFTISLILSFAIPIGAFLGFFGDLTPANLVGVVTLTYLLIILMSTLLGMAIIIGERKPMSYSDLIALNQFLKTENYSKKFSSITFLIFILPFIVVLFGFVFDLNVIIVLCIIIFLLSILWIFGIIDSIPDHASTLLLSNEKEISDVFIFNKEGEFITGLSRKLGWVHYNKNAIIRICDDTEDTNYSNHSRESTQSVRDFIFDSDMNGRINNILVIFAIFFGYLAYRIPQFFPENLIIIGYFIIFIPITIVLLLILRKYAVRYWE
jgi:hypothetical protein